MKESKVILGVNFTHSAPCLQDKVVHEVGILCSSGVVHGAADENAFSVHHDDSLHSFLALKSLECFLHLRLPEKETKIRSSDPSR